MWGHVLGETGVSRSIECGVTALVCMNIDKVIRAILAGASGFARCALFEYRG